MYDLNKEQYITDLTITIQNTEDDDRNRTRLLNIKDKS